MNDHTKGYGFKDVYGALVQNFSFTPTAHINYGLITEIPFLK